MKEEIDLSKTDKKFGKHDLEAGLSVAFVVLLILYLIFSFQVNTFVETTVNNFFWSLKPYSTIHFEKLENPSPDFRICNIKSLEDFSFHVSFDMTVATNNKNITIYESPTKQKPLETININGQIDKIECYHLEAKDRLINKKKSVSPYNTGLFMFCSYSANNSRTLACYKVTKEEPTQTDETQVGDYEVSTKYAKPPNHVVKITTLFEIPFFGKRFIDVSKNDSAITGFIVENTSNNSIELYSTDNKLLSSVKPPKIVSVIPVRSIENQRIIVFDGRQLHNINVKDNKLVTEKVTLVTTKESSDFVWLHKELQSEQSWSIPDIAFKLDGRIYLFSTYSNTLVRTNFSDKVSPGYGCIVNQEGSVFFLVSEESESFALPYTTISQRPFYPCFDRRFGFNEHSPILAALKPLSGESTVQLVIYNIFHEFVVLGTSGINEPIDQAYVNLEDGKLTIYLMNKNSIYRWQNWYECMNNLKLRKLDLKPEPIKNSDK